MALNVSAWSIRRPLPAVVLALVLLALGAASFRKLPITLLPNVDPPVVSVVIAPGLASCSGRHPNSAEDTTCGEFMSMSVPQRERVVREWQRTDSRTVVTKMYDYVLEECQYGHALPDQKIGDIYG